MMGTTLTETPEQIAIIQTGSAGMRLALVIVGLIPLWGFYDMLLRPRWNLSALSFDNFWILLPPLIIGISCLGMTIAIVGLAILGSDKSFTFDRQGKRLTYQASRRLFISGKRAEYSFSELALPSVEKETFSDGPDRWDVRIRLPGHRRPNTLYGYATEAEAVALANRLLA